MGPDPSKRTLTVVAGVGAAALAIAGVAIAQNHEANENRKRGVEAADYAASAISGRWGAAQFHGMSSSQRDAGHPSAIFAMTSPI